MLHSDELGENEESEGDSVPFSMYVSMKLVSKIGFLGRVTNTRGSIISDEGADVMASESADLIQARCSDGKIR